MIRWVRLGHGFYVVLNMVKSFKQAFFGTLVAILTLGVIAPEAAQCTEYFVTLQPSRIKAIKGATCNKPSSFKMLFSMPTKSRVKFLSSSKRLGKTQRAVFTRRAVDDKLPSGHVMTAIFLRGAKGRVRVREVAFALQMNSARSPNINKLPRCLFEFRSSAAPTKLG